METRQFQEILTRECILSGDQCMIAGISGGPDTLCMLDLLCKSGLPFIAAHLNHHLRLEADEEENFVREFCKERKIQFIIGSVDVTGFSIEHHLSIEEAARNLRYKFLFEQAVLHKAQAVLVAHNSDDQVETVLMHLVRGTGLSGLKGMQMRSVNRLWSDSIPLIRPLLFTSREEILNYCATNELNPTHDKSNEDKRFFRNRIRSTLIPELLTFNPRVKERILTMAEVLSAEDELINTSMKEFWDLSMLTNTRDYLVFSRDALLKSPLAILRRILKTALWLINPDLRDIEFNVVERARRFIVEMGRTSHLSLIGSVEILRYKKDQIILCLENNSLKDLWPQVKHGSKLAVRIPGDSTLGERWILNTKILNFFPTSNTDLMCCTLDLDLISDLMIETFQPGDQFHPFGMAGKSIKLGDFWTNAGLPVRARAEWPVIKSGGKIVWIPGFRIGEEYKVTPTTKRFLFLEVKH